MQEKAPVVPSSSDSAWPADWAALYDEMDVDRRPHLQFYTSLVSEKTTSLLDLGCGTGSITVPMAALMPVGARVVGVDLSAKMVEIAARRAPAYTWIVGDICAPPVTGPFDLIVICFHTVQALLTDADLLRAFRNIAGLLSPAGQFAFDIYQPNEAWLASVNPSAAVARTFTGAQGCRFNVVESNAHYDAETRILSGEWRLQDADTLQILPVEPIVQRVRQYAPADIDAALARSGMVATSRFGELDRRPLAAGTKRQVYVCTRP